MEFIVSERILKYKAVKGFFENQYTLMPEWFKTRVAGDVTVLVGTSPSVTKAMEAELSLPVPNRVIKIVSTVNHAGSVVNLFAGLIREIMGANDAFKERFITLVLPEVRSGFSFEDYSRVVFQHLVISYLKLPSMRHDIERYALCQRIASGLEEVELQSNGTLV